MASGKGTEPRWVTPQVLYNSNVSMSIHNKPTARQIQPTGLCGRLEAIRAPTMGKARKGHEDQPVAYRADGTPVARRLHGRSEEIRYNVGDEHGHREGAE